MKIKLALMIFFVTPLCFAGTNLITNSNSKKEIQLDDEAQKVLKKWDSQFKVFQADDFPKTILDLFKDEKSELPMAILADFNGDQKTDVALLGFSQKKERVVVLLAQDKSYVAVEVHSRDYVNPKANTIENEFGQKESGLSFYLSLLSSKELVFKNNKTHALKPDALQLENYLGQTKAYYFKANAKKSFDVKEYKGMID